MLGGGADRAFERLYRRHVGDVHRYAATVLANAADAEDVAQTVFLNAYRAYSAGERPDRPLNWLITITHNVCRQRFRDGARRPREVALDEDLVIPLEDTEKAYRREDIVRALEQLSFNQRAALVLRELEGRSYGDIASILKLSTSAVETLIFRARRAFREQLEGSLTCSEAQHAISLQLDGRLERSQRGPLRAHLRSCLECASLARRFRAQRSGLRRLAVLPLPQSLAGGFGAGGGAAVGSAVGVKAVAFGTAAIVAVGAGTSEIVRHVHAKSSPAQVPRSAWRAAPAVTAPSAQLVSRTEAAEGSLVSVRPRHDAAAPARPRHITTTTTTTTAQAAQAPTPAATPIAETSTAAPAHEQGVRDRTVARRQPQPSGGGVSRHQLQNVTTREAHHGRPADPETPSESKGRSDSPGNSDHPKSDDHPGQEKNGGGPPTAKKQPGQQPDAALPASEDEPGLGLSGKPQDQEGNQKAQVPPGKKHWR